MAGTAEKTSFNPSCPVCKSNEFLYGLLVKDLNSANFGREFLKCGNPNCTQEGFIGFTDGKPSRGIPAGARKWSPTPTTAVNTPQ